MAKVQKVSALKTLDSRGNPTVSVTVTLSNGITASPGVPSGASTGIREAVEETLEDSLCAELVDEAHHGMAFGTLATVNGVGDFLSSVIVGALWTWAGTTVAFTYCGLLFVAGAGWVLRVAKE